MLLAFGHAAVGNSLEARGEVFSDLARHETEFPAGFVIDPGSLVFKEMVPGGGFIAFRVSFRPADDLPCIMRFVAHQRLA